MLRLLTTAMFVLAVSVASTSWALAVVTPP